MSFATFHIKNWNRMQSGAFGKPHEAIALVACVAEEVGELARAVLRYEGEKKRTTATRAEVLDAVADSITYLSLVAAYYGCDDLETLLIDTFDMVSERVNCPIRVKE
jgi:NTP pyrophosphatase (non-canonical NTP hydrolase)